MLEDEIRPSDLHCGGCGFYLGLGECILPPGRCVLTEPERFEAAFDRDGAEQMIQMEGDTT